jgi:hypothetical protein
MAVDFDIFDAPKHKHAHALTARERLVAHGPSNWTGGTWWDLH